MAIYTLLEKDNTALTIPLSGCSKDLDRVELKENLIATMNNFHGIGLSASQCGVMERAFVMYSDVKKKEIIACFNPQIISEGTEMVTMDEGCLTWPGIWLKIKRPDHIDCTFEDENGDLKEANLDGMMSRAFQHEYDHILGRNFTEMASELKLERAFKKAGKKMQEHQRRIQS